MTSTVYFVQAESGLIKIGYSINVASRVRSLETAVGPLRVRLTLNGGRALEQHLHNLFAEHRRHGEWFFPADRLLDFIMFGVNFGSDLFGPEIPEGADSAGIDRIVPPFKEPDAVFTPEADKEAREILKRAASVLDAAGLIAQELTAKAFKVAPWLKPTDAEFGVSEEKLSVRRRT